jgi:hypothetical protein
MAILILAINQLLGRKSLTKIGEWVSETPIPRWTKIDTNKLNHRCSVKGILVNIQEYYI